MLDALPARASREPAHAARVELRARRLPRRRSSAAAFALVICPFNAFMHLYTREDVERFLAVVRAHLAPGGLFAFDVLNPDLAWLSRDPDAPLGAHALPPSAHGQAHLSTRRA